MSLVDDISGEQSEQLAVLYCDVSQAEAGTTEESDVALWRASYFRAAREMAADFGGHEAATAAGGWAATFSSTVEALVCAQALSSLVGWQTGGPSLSGGLSAGEVTRDPFGIGGSPVREAIALCHQARPRQVLVADPIKVVVARDTAGSFASAPLQPSADLGGSMAPARAPSPRAPTPGTPSPRTGSVIGRGKPWSSAGARLVDPGRHSGHSRRLSNLDGRFPTDRATADRATADQATAEPALRLLSSTDPQFSIVAAAPAPTSSPSAGRAAPGATVTAVALAPTADPATTGLRLRILGWVQIEAGEPSVRRAVMRGSQAQAVLCMLALRRGPVHKDELAELLWPGALPDHWEGALRGLITKIRRFLDGGGLRAREALVGESGYYELRLPPGVTVDRDVAAVLIASAETALAEDRPVEAALLARRAVTILERRLLSGRDNAWFDQVRAELAHDRLATLELWARADLAAGGMEGAKRAATEALALDPFRESSYRLLMQAHAAAGSRGEALRTYERCRRMLAEELGVEPAAQTQALYIDLLG